MAFCLDGAFRAVIYCKMINCDIVSKGEREDDQIWYRRLACHHCG